MNENNNQGAIQGGGGGEGAKSFEKTGIIERRINGEN